MTRFFTWLLVTPFILFLVIFAVSNREPVELTFWPFPFTIAAPLYLFFLTLCFGCFALGALAAWIGQHRARADAKRYKRELETLKAQLAAMPPVSPVTTQVQPLLPKP